MALPLCAAAGCHLCAPWRSRSGAETTLVEAVAVAERMRQGGWYPHQDLPTQGWDAVGDEATPADPVGPALAAELAALARSCADDRPAPLATLNPEERRAGGVDPFMGAADADLPGRQDQPPHTRTGAVDRRPLYEAIVAQVASGHVERGEATVLGRLFLGPKGRPLLDPAAANAAIPPACRAVRYGRLCDLLGPGVAFGVKADLKAAFASVPVAESRRPLLGFEVDGVVLRYRVLPFGLATSPRLFVEQLRRTLSHVPREPTAAVVDYVDDVGVAAATPEAACRQLIAIITALRRDGWRVAVGKTHARPTPGLVFLGWHLQLATRHVSLTPSRREKILSWLDDAPRHRRSLEKLLGVTSWAAPVLRCVGLVLPPLWRVAHGGAAWGEEAAVALDTLRSIIDRCTTPVPLDFVPARIVSIVTDASDGAWAWALVEKGDVRRMGRGSLSSGQAAWSSTAREAVAVVSALEELGLTDATDVLVEVGTDSQSLARILTVGRTRSPEVARALRVIVDLAQKGTVVRSSWCRRTDGLQPWSTRPRHPSGTGTRPRPCDATSGPPTAHSTSTSARGPGPSRSPHATPPGTRGASARPPRRPSQPRGPDGSGGTRTPTSPGSAFWCTHSGGTRPRWWPGSAPRSPSPS